MSRKYRIAVVLAAFVLIAKFSSAAESTDSAQAIKRITQTWKQVATNGFKNIDEARRVMATYEDDKAALSAFEKNPGGQASLASQAKKDLTEFQAYLNKKQTELLAKLQRQVKSSTMVAKRWDTVSKQALAAGNNVQEGMIQVYKRTSMVDALRKDSDMLMAIAGPDHAEAKQIAEQVDYIERVGIQMGAVDNAVTPRDDYSGADKADLKAKVEKAWKAARPNDEILGIRFIDANWARRTEKRYNNTLGWYPLDFSSLEVKVVVKEDDHMAAIYPVYLTKDHLKGDALEIDVDTATTTPFVKSKMLLKNYKP